MTPSELASLHRAAESSVVFREIFDSLTLFPLRPILRTADGLACTCRAVERCGQIGKHPDGTIVPSWRELATGEKVCGLPGCGYGIATGSCSGIFVIDLDGADAIHAFYEGGDVPRTFAVKRGDDRRHLYFRHPSFRVKNTASALLPGVDVRGDGGYVVCLGSPHRSGQFYEIADDVPILDAPAWLLEWEGLRKHEEQGAVPPPVPVIPGSPEEAGRIAEAIERLTNAPPAISGKNGHAQTFIIAQVLMRTLELPVETAYALFVTHYNPRCEPPWSEREIRHKLEQARTHGRFELRSEVERFNAGMLAAANGGSR